MYIFLLFIVLLVSASPAQADEFVLNPDGFVTDLSSGLVWQGSSSRALSGHDAADYCNQIDTKGFYRWRLPNRTELASLDASLQSQVPAVYWASADLTANKGVYCFGDGAFFEALDIELPALVRCVSEDLSAPVIAALNAWAESWQNGDVEAYLSSYVRGYQPQSDIDHSVWEAQRRQRLSSAVAISIELQTEEINPRDKQRVEVVLLQDYRSRHYQDRVRKRLLLKYQQGRWLIAKEEQLTSLPQQTFSATKIYSR